MKGFMLLIILIFFCCHYSYPQSTMENGQTNYILHKPSGVYQIGTLFFSAVDSARLDSAENKKGREIAFQLFYPSSSSSDGVLNYIPEDLTQAMLKDHYNNVDSAVLLKWKQLRTHSSRAASVVPNKRFPVLFFLHGFGMSRYSYLTIIEELTSRGFVVVSVDSPHSGLVVLSDGRIYQTINDNKPVQKCEAMAGDVSFILNWLEKSKNKDVGGVKKCMDLKKIGVLGHSLGGAAALETCRTDLRFLACIDMDGDTWGKVDNVGLNRPSLILLNEPIVKDSYFTSAEQKKGWEKMRDARRKGWQDLIDKNPAAPIYIFRIAGAAHFTFTDFPFVTTDYYKSDHFATAETIIEKNRGLDIISAYVTTFFSEYLVGNKTINIKSLTKVFPETNLYLTTK